GSACLSTSSGMGGGSTFGGRYSSTGRTGGLGGSGAHVSSWIRGIWATRAGRPRSLSEPPSSATATTSVSATVTKWARTVLKLGIGPLPQAAEPPERVGRTYGPLGMTATLASGPYSASESARADSTLAAGSTKHAVRTAAGRPSLTTLTCALRRTF